ncbi:hypothetical protein ACU5AX_19460 [Sphingomonas sp. XXL09]|uniref:hypothetical protein n=1 Tax=Sphingomonas sp. XXL09 TaxID=3457787 RepID=UPI00406BA35D
MIVDDRQDGDSARYIVDRGWSLQVGAVQLTRWHRRYAVHADAGHDPAPPKRSLLFSPRAALGGVAICALSFTAASLMVERVGARPTYAIDIPVPPRNRAPEVVHHAPTARLTRVVSSEKRTRQRLHHLTSDEASSPLAAAVDAPGLHDPLAGEASQARAIKTAMTTGDMQEWTDEAAGIHGFVVAGPLREEDGQRCRAMSVLIRTLGQGDQVEQRHDCLP